MATNIGTWRIPHAIGSHETFSFAAGGRAWSQNVGGLPARAAVADREGDACERWLLWQAYRYKKLAAQGSYGADLAVTESLLARGGSRREWASISSHWQEGDESAAFMSLIAELANEKHLIHAIRSIERSPRRMLLRAHKARKVSRVEEMDTVTLRAYARAPGRTAAEKAGPRQELLAVVREDTVDLPENRIFRWLVERLVVMARSWVAQHQGLYGGSDDAKRIKVLAGWAGRAAKSEQFAGVGALSYHLSSPTYCLQFDRRYRHIWKAYRRIRTQDQMMDDAFRWQSRLWATTSRLLLSSLLQSSGGAGWREEKKSAVYFRQASITGDWLWGPSSPGPFVAAGMGLCHVVDLRDVTSDGVVSGLGLPAEAYESGAECILVWPGQRRLCFVWSAVVHQADEELVDQVALASRLGEFGRDSGWRCSGLVMRADPAQAASPSDRVSPVHGGPLHVMRLPHDMHRHWRDLSAWLSNVLEEVLR